MSERVPIKGKGIFEKSVRTSLAQDGQNERSVFRWSNGVVTQSTKKLLFI